MPLFFIDVQLGNVLEEDAEGIELPDVSAAKDHCTAGLIDLARHLVAANVTRSVTATVRDDVGAVLAMQTLSLTCSLS